jgi:hypothetical protein
MDNFESLFESFTTRQHDIPFIHRDSFYVKEDTNNFLGDYIENGKYYLSEYIRNLNIPSKRMKVVTNVDVKVGVLGIYRHAYPKTEIHDYGYLEEMRLITKISLYSNYLMLSLSAIKFLEYTTDGLYCEYIESNIVKLILYSNEVPAIWVKLDRSYRFIKGCSFQSTPIFVGRTFVKDGQYVEKEGRIYSKSANLVIPNRFIDLFKQTTNDDTIIW